MSDFHPFGEGLYAQELWGGPEDPFAFTQPERDPQEKMGLKLLITVGQTITDYTAVLDQSTLTISERLNMPSQMKFTIVNFGGKYEVPPTNSYVQLVSEKINNLPGSQKQSVFSGYISAPPSVTFLGMAAYGIPFTRGQMLAHEILCTSDDYLLNIKSVPFIPAFVNRTQGQILSDLANILCPGLFDTSSVYAGDIVPYFDYTPTMNWSQIAKQFGDSIRFRYKVRDHKIWFAPYGDANLGISYDEEMPQGTFKALTLKTTPLTTPIINDVTIVGDTEAGNMWRSYFIGDGFSANYPLRHKVFRGSSTLLLQESWNQSRLNTQQWYLQDPGGNFNLDVGALNIVSPNAVGTYSAYGQRLLVYWGNPLGLNGYNTTDAIARQFSQYSYVMLRFGLDDPADGQHLPTSAIISQIKSTQPFIKFFGYVNAAGAGPSLSTITTSIGRWAAMGVDGILCDNFGFNQGCSRARQNAILDAIHAADLVAAVTCPDPADAYGHTVNATYNPGGTLTTTHVGDYFLLKSFVVDTAAYSSTGGWESAIEVRQRAEAIVSYRSLLNIRILGSAICDFRQFTLGQQAAYFNTFEGICCLYSFEGYGLDAVNFSNSGNEMDKVQTEPYTNLWPTLYKPGQSVAVDTNTGTIFQRLDSNATVNLSTHTVSSSFNSFGLSYLALNNGLELAGGIDLQHGEFVFNDKSDGILGGVFSDDSFDVNSWLFGYLVSSPNGVTTGASGAGGVIIQPAFGGHAVGAAITTKPNHTYVLQNIVTAPLPTRYNRVYRSGGGTQYGGGYNTVNGYITWNVQGYDIAQATGFYYQPDITTYSVGPVVLPAFATYCLANNDDLNITVTSTTIAMMPMGALDAYVGSGGLYTPSGLVLPALDLSLNKEYRGPVQGWKGLQSQSAYAVTGTGSNALWPKPLILGTQAQQQVLGAGFDLQAAQISSGNESDTLAFYAQTIPAAGTQIALTTWESQAAVSRVQSRTSIENQKFIVGDDGIRAAIVTDLNPLPRTSEDCDHAALSYLDDHLETVYNGSYACESYFFTGQTREPQYWPTVGRYIFVNSPMRDVVKRNLLVTSLTINILDLAGEVMNYQIQFGADLVLDKTIRNFLNLKPQNILTNQDTAKPSNPRWTTQVGLDFLPDLNDVRADALGVTSIAVPITMDAPFNRIIEVRVQDTNWGQGATYDLVGWFAGPMFFLVRTQYEQTWYMRQVDSQGVSLRTSRRSLAIHVAHPQRPSHPVVVSADSHFFQLDFNGDHRNIYGIEIRNQGGIPIWQSPVASYQDLYIDLTLTLNSAPDTPYRIIYAQFFNLRWEYSDSARYQDDQIQSSYPGIQCIFIPQYPKPTLKVGYRFGQMLNIIAADSSSRTDVLTEVWTIARDAALTSVVAKITNNTKTTSLSVTVPLDGDLYVTCIRNDYIGPGIVSDVLHIPQGDLLASDYAAGQGSIPPFVTDAGGGPLFTYTSTDHSITVSMVKFDLIGSNGSITSYPAFTPQTFTVTKNDSSPLGAGTSFYFYMSMDSPAVGTNIYVDGPYYGYVTYRNRAIGDQIKDGRIPLSAGGLVFSTAAAGQTGGGGGGGSSGGGACGILSSEITLANGEVVSLEKADVGNDVLAEQGAEKIVHAELVKRHVWTVRTRNGYETTVAATHTFMVRNARKDHYATVLDLLDSNWRECSLKTRRGKFSRVVEIRGAGVDYVKHLELSGPSHVYVLDGFWTHNTLFKA